jgi:hypothetical protein
MCNQIDSGALIGLNGRHNHLLGEKVRDDSVGLSETQAKLGTSITLPTEA